MFKGLTTFEMARSPLQAFGFYIFYFVIGVLIGAVVGALGSAVMHAETQQAAFDEGLRWGTIFAVPYVLAIALTIVVKKKLGPGYYVLAVVCGLLGLAGGALLGLIPAAFMTTRQVRMPASSEPAQALE